MIENKGLFLRENFLGLINYFYAVKLYFYPIEGVNCLK